MFLRAFFPRRLRCIQWFGLALLALATIPAWPQETAEVLPPRLEVDVPATLGGTGPTQITVRTPDGLLLLRSAVVKSSLPAKARAVLSQFEKEQEQARLELEVRSAARRASAIDQLEQMAAERDQAGAPAEAGAIRTALKNLQDKQPRPTVKAAADPGNLTAYRDRIGQRFNFDVTGSTEGTVWGSRIYTDDSKLSVAAVHRGILKPGERGVVRVTILPGLESYEGSTQNGITSYPYEEWQGSYLVEPLLLNTANGLQPGVGGNGIENSRDRIDPNLQWETNPIFPSGTSVGAGHPIDVPFPVQITGSTQGNVWGTDVYTSDSSLEAAAVHAGALRDGERGMVIVIMRPGQESYMGSEHNGVISRPWKKWDSSFTVKRMGGVEEEKRSSGGAPIDTDPKHSVDRLMLD